MMRCVSVLVIAAAACLPAAGSISEHAATFPALGWVDDSRGDPLPVDLRPEEGGPRWLARLTAEWSEVEVEPGRYEWDGLEARVEELRRAGAEVSLCLNGTHAHYLPDGGEPSPRIAGAVEAWIRFVRSAVRALGERVAVYEILELPSGGGAAVPLPVEEYAYLLKQSSLAIRAEAEHVGLAEPRVAQGAVDSRRLAWQRDLWEQDTAAYVDILPIRFDGASAGNLDGVLGELIPLSLGYPPAPVIWARFEAGEGRELGPILSAPLAALAAGATVAMTGLPEEEPSRQAGVRWLAGAARILAGGYAPAPLEAGSLRYDQGAGDPAGGVTAKFFHDQTFLALLAYRLEDEDGTGRKAWLRLPSSFVRNPHLIDPVTGRRLRTITRKPTGGDAGSEVRVDPAPYPMLLEYQAAVATPGLELDTEELQVERNRDPTASEIIARYQEVQEIQDQYVERWMARARVDYHFKLAQGGTNVDVSIRSRYFWRRGEALEWEQSEYSVNGNRVPWKTIPEIPLIQPEKVVTLPMDLTLDKTYSYRMIGQDKVEGRDAWVLAFEPEDPDPEQALYRGRIWIDREKYVRLKVSLIQGNLEAPVLSNEERDIYRPVEGDGGRELWMMSRTVGQQVWTAAGSNFLVQREVTFEEYDINPDEERFQAARSAAYRSENQMLRDTDEGFRYLERQPDGSRTVKTEMDTSQLFAAAGLFKDNSLDNVIPLGGADYFDYDLFGKGIQANVLFAGVFLNASATDPDLFGGKVDLTLQVQGSALKFDDKVFDGDREQLAERIRTRRQSATLQAGVPLGRFTKFNLSAGLDFVQYDQEEEAEAYRAGLAEPLEFVLPPDHSVSSLTAELIFNHRGYTLSASRTAFRRSEWGEWGLFDPVSGSFVEPAADPSLERYDRWQASINKEWFLPTFQKLRAGLTYLGGSDLDRFSQYELTYFGRTRLSGFSGSGVRFDEGGIFRAGYSFNLFNLVQLDASLQTASVRNLLVDRETRNFTGAGIALNTPGPWKTYFLLDYGRALSADIPELEGQQEIMLTVLKLF